MEVGDRLAKCSQDDAALVHYLGRDKAESFRVYRCQGIIKDFLLETAVLLTVQNFALS